MLRNPNLCTLLLSLRLQGKFYLLTNRLSHQFSNYRFKRYSLLWLLHLHHFLKFLYLFVANFILTLLQVSEVALKRILLFDLVKLVIDPVIKLRIVIHLILLVNVFHSSIEPET